MPLIRYVAVLVHLGLGTFFGLPCFILSAEVLRSTNPGCKPRDALHFQCSILSEWWSILLIRTPRHLGYRHLRRSYADHIVVNHGTVAVCEAVVECVWRSDMLCYDVMLFVVSATGLAGRS